METGAAVTTAFAYPAGTLPTIRNGARAPCGTYMSVRPVRVARRWPAALYSLTVIIDGPWLVDVPL